MSDDNNIQVQLARIEGKQDLTNERLNNVQTEIIDIRRTLNSHGDRLGILEAAGNVRIGERNGIGLSGKILIALASIVTGGIGAAALGLIK